MDKQKHALYTLTEVAKLSPNEAVSLTLGDLSLAGNNPTLKVWDEETGQRKTITINKNARDALVAWLLERPDRPTTLFFPGENDEGLNPDDIPALLADFTPPPSAPSPENAEPLSASTLAEEGLPSLKPTPPRPGGAKQPAPPPKSRPEPIVGVTSAPPPVARPETISGGAEMTAPTPVVKDTPPAKGFSFGPAAIIIAILFFLACLGLIAGGAFLARDQIAALRGPSATPVAIEAIESTVEIVAMPDTPTPAPTNTSTNTPEPPAPPASPVETPTPEPTATPTQKPTETPTAEPTETPTPEPTETPTPRPTNTPVPAGEEPAPAPTATTGFKYSAPVALEPEPDQHFIAGNTIVLQWEPVGELAGDEQYAVRVIYRHNTEVVYRGAQLKDTRWTVPLEFYRDADGPEFLYTWYVYVEAVQPDGAGVAISPESKHRSFTWE